MKRLSKTTIEWASLVLFTLSVLITSIIDVNYSFVAPGYNNNIESFIEFEDEIELSGSFYTTSVISSTRTSWLQYQLSTLFEHTILTEKSSFYDTVDDDDLSTRSLFMKDDSLAVSIVLAAKEAGIDIDYESYQMIYLVTDYLTEDTIDLGDKIISVNGIDPYLFDYSTVDCGEIITMEILREDITYSFDIERQDIDGSCLFGFYYDTFTEITEDDLGISYDNNNTGGPSGGLMQTLYNYSQFIQKDITGGLKIAGTGTIDILGTVGPIGGIEQKIVTAVGNNIDVFFVPDVHYSDAKIKLNTLDSDMLLISVSTFTEALTALEEVVQDE